MEWFERWFGEDYLLVYHHRDEREAEKDVAAILTVLDPEPGARILDLCCGSGRHDRPLADRGYRIFGLDFSPALLSSACECKQRRPGRYPLYVRADAHDSVFREGAFDIVLNLFTSFGYFSDEENRAFIREIGRILRPGGRYYIDYLNPPRVLETLVPESRSVKDGVTITERRKYDSRACRIEKAIILDRDGETKEFHESVRLYDCGELMAMMNEAGLSIDGVLGSIAGEVYTESSPRMILYGARRRG